MLYYISDVKLKKFNYVCGYYKEQNEKKLLPCVGNLLWFFFCFFNQKCAILCEWPRKLFYTILEK